MMFCLRPRQHFHWCFILPANEVETWRTRTWRCVPKTTRTTNVAERSSHAFFCCEANYQQLKCNPRLFFASLIIVFFAALLSPSSKKGVSAYSVATWQAQLAYSVLSQAVSTDLWASLSNCFRLCISLLPDEISARQFEKNESKLVWQHLLCSLFVSTCAKSVISCENKIFAKKTSSISTCTALLPFDAQDEHRPQHLSPNKRSWKKPVRSSMSINNRLHGRREGPLQESVRHFSIIFENTLCSSEQHYVSLSPLLLLWGVFLKGLLLQ